MAKLRIAPETLIERMFPELRVSLVSIGYDMVGAIVLEIEGDDVPEGCERINAEITRIGPPYERIKLVAA